MLLAAIALCSYHAITRVQEAITGCHAMILPVSKIYLSRKFGNYRAHYIASTMAIIIPYHLCTQVNFFLVAVIIRSMLITNSGTR